jgi:hypothetical protein
MRFLTMAAGVMLSSILLHVPAVVAQDPAVPGIEQVQELALRWALAHHETDLRHPAAYCVALVSQDPSVRPAAVTEPADPPESFLRRFAGQTPAVRPNSTCDNVAHPRHSVVYAPTGERALHFTLGPVERRTAEEAVVGVSYRQGGRWGKGWSCTARLEVENWTISRCRVTWIS